MPAFLGKFTCLLSCPELDKRITTNILRLQPAAKIKDYQICLQSLLHFGFSHGVSASPGQEIMAYIIPCKAFILMKDLLCLIVHFTHAYRWIFVVFGQILASLCPSVLTEGKSSFRFT